jgi:hypothetical protein
MCPSLPFREAALRHAEKTSLPSATDYQSATLRVVRKKDGAKASFIDVDSFSNSIIDHVLKNPTFSV